MAKNQSLNAAAKAKEDEFYTQLADIPCDYAGLMGVPITFLDKYNPDQFEIIGQSRTLGRPMSEIAEKGEYVSGGVRFYIEEDASK